MKTKFACVVISLLFCVSPVFSIAAEMQISGPVVNKKITEPESMDFFKSEEKPEARTIFANQSFEFGLMYQKFDYKEDVPAPYKSTENGWLPGFYLGWNYNKKSGAFSKVFLEFSFGDVEYDGTTQAGTPVKFSEDNYQFLFRGEWNIGYKIAITKDISIKPYAGYGYRYWSRGQEKITATYTSYNEKYYWHYIPVGIGADFNIGERLVIEPNVGLRIMFYGKMIAYLSELNSANDDPEFKLGNRTGWYAEIPFRYKFSQFWSVVIKPWYEYSEIGKSDYVEYTYNGSRHIAYEPASRTHQYGMNAGVVFSY
jgi:hypothetical protein